MTVLQKYTWIERRRIHRKAKTKLGLIKDIGDYDDFMSDCVDNMMDDVDTMDEDTATETCQMLWDEEGTD